MKSERLAAAVLAISVIASAQPRESSVQPAPKPAASAYAESLAQAKTGETWVHPLFQRLETDCKGPFVALRDGRLLTVNDKGLRISQDDGKTWEQTVAGAHGQNPEEEPGSCHVVETTNGTLVMVYLDLKAKNRKFAWNDQKGEPGDDCSLELHAVRSLDGGKTWVDRQCLLDGYNANFFGFIRTRGGRLVAVTEHLLPNPGRWVVSSFGSDDDGHTWRRSNLIDLGGHGHHDGAIEPTLAELGDGRLMMLIRTNFGRFWQAFSDDGGRYWRTIQPGQIDASSSPGHLVRLRSGRLVLVWNRMNPESGSIWPLTHNKQASEFPCSWYREELSIAVTEADGKTWSRPIVLAKLKGGQLSYPCVFERRPGELWVTAGFASRKWFNAAPVPLGLRVREEQLLGAMTPAAPGRASPAEGAGVPQK